MEAVGRGRLECAPYMCIIHLFRESRRRGSLKTRPLLAKFEGIKFSLVAQTRSLGIFVSRNDETSLFELMLREREICATLPAVISL